MVKHLSQIGKIIIKEMVYTCLNCNGNDSYIRKDNPEKPSWRWIVAGFVKGYFCRKCYDKLIWTPQRQKIYNPRKLCYKGKQIILEKSPRTHICSNCGKEGLTHMHHKEYHDNDISKDTIELCVSCHNKTRPRNKSGQFEKEIG